MANPITKIILSAVDRTKAAFGSVKGGLESIGSSARALSGMLGSIFVGLSVAGFVGKVKQAVDAMDEVSKGAQKAGTSVKNLSALNFAADQSGVKDMTKSLVALVDSLDQAKSGTGPAAEAFATLRIDPTQFTDSSDALDAIADQFARMPNGVNKTALAIDLFGKKIGPEMIPLLNQGRDGIRAFKDEAAALNKVISDEAGAAAEQFNDNLDKLKGSADGLGIAIAEDMLPGLNEITRLMAEAAKQGGLTAAALAAVKFVGTDYLRSEELSSTYRLSRAQEELNALRADGFEEDHKRVKQLRETIPFLETLAAAEKALAEQRKKDSKSTSEELAKNHKAEAKAFKESIDERISDARRLQGALQSAFSQALGEEEQYTKEAKKLREKASSSPSGDQSQESIRLDATLAAMKLQRLKANGDPEEIRDQAEAVKELASRLEDQEYSTWLVTNATLAEAAAADKSAAAAGERAAGLAEQMRANEGRISEVKEAAEALDKPVALDVVSTEQTDASLVKLREIKGLIDFIKDAGPINVNTSAPAGTDTTAENLRRAALQYGNRR